jgi:hypothetical protein
VANRRILRRRAGAAWISTSAQLFGDPKGMRILDDPRRSRLACSMQALPHRKGM